MIFDMDRGTDVTMVNVDTNILKSDVGGGSVKGKVDEIATVEPFKESSEEVSTMEPK